MYVLQEYFTIDFIRYIYKIHLLISGPGSEISLRSKILMYTFTFITLLITTTSIIATKSNKKRIFIFIVNLIDYLSVYMSTYIPYGLDLMSYITLLILIYRIVNL
jgi:hypothetical protein